MKRYFMNLLILSCLTAPLFSEKMPSGPEAFVFSFDFFFLPRASIQQTTEISVREETGESFIPVMTTETLTNNEGFPLEIQTLSISGEIQKQQIFSYENNKLIKVQTREKDYPGSTETFIYNDQGEIIEGKIIYDDGVSLNVEYTKEKPNTITRNITDKSSPVPLLKETLIYDKTGKLMIYQNYDIAGNPSSLIRYIYTENILKKAIMKNPDGSLSGEMLFLRDKNGEISILSYYDPDKREQNRSQIIYREKL